ncbi:hypothetical protein Aph01nite_14740 [Acrocarpospora phusangensis]|uniref:Cell division protein FtsL n=1 Tax=Acrocarpospora phusangensis TaxID=1070424 RepID=A0A919UIJ9_9ACTN|nr:hypothetical protein [Acrocarpospora phusangensis]GIH23164.1 hypothetical protein Aph01nite_14740 [Acrocarpospora phusangensis]
MTTDQDRRRAGAEARTRARVPGRMVPGRTVPERAASMAGTAGTAAAAKAQPAPVRPAAAKPAVQPGAPQAPAKPPVKSRPKSPLDPRPKAESRAESAAPKVAVKAGAIRASGRRPPRAPFVLLVVGLLGGGLVSLLLLNTVLAQDSFKYNELRRITEQLHQQADAENNRIREAQQPTRLAERAGQAGLKPDVSAPEFVGDGMHPASLGERLPDEDGGSGAPASTTEGTQR